MSSNADIVIAGAGIIGLAIAWQLARRSRLRIRVLEKGASLGEGSTGASSAVCRHRYTHPEMVQLARDGIHAYRHWQDFTGLSQARASFQGHGVLWMPGADRTWAAREHARLGAMGIATTVLDDTELAERFPAFNPCVQLLDFSGEREHRCGGGGSHLLELDGGYMDPIAAVEDLREACLAAGVMLSLNAEVQAVETSAGRVRSVTLADAGRLETPVFINATGPWCNALLGPLALTQRWQLKPTRIQVLYLDRPPELTGDIPVAVDMDSGLYFRTQNLGQQLVVGSTQERDELEVVDNPDDFDRFPDEAFKQRVLHALHHRLPGLPYRGSVRGYCGLYTVNRQDLHPLIGATPIAGLYLANGFSGHGFKVAPAVGALLAQSITGVTMEFDSTAPLEFFALDREPHPLASRSVLA